MFSQQDIFGQVALRRGFVTSKQLRAALKRQAETSNGSTRLLGLVLLEEGIISTSQLIEVLREVRALNNTEWMRRKLRMPRLREKAS